MRDRLNQLRRYYKSGLNVLEIGPYFTPIFPKKIYGCVRSVDAFDYDELVRRASADPNIDRKSIAEIETVDFVWKGSLGETLGDDYSTLDLVVSSHNFEHQPDPIQFLIDAERYLGDTGVLSMAIPTATRCFDALRPLTTTGIWIDWYQRQTKPTYGILVDNNSNFCTLDRGNVMHHGTFSVQDLEMPGDILNTPFSDQRRNFSDYRDAHCSVLTIESLKLILYDLNRLGILSSLKMIDGIDGDFEFIVHLSRGWTPMGFYDSDRKTLALNSLGYYRNELNSLFGQAPIHR
jgi:hypothetical protein